MRRGERTVDRCGGPKSFTSLQKHASRLTAAAVRFYLEGRQKLPSVSGLTGSRPPRAPGDTLPGKETE